VISSANDLVEAARDESVSEIVVKGDLFELPSIRLRPGQTLRGADEQPRLAFVAGIDGLQVSSDNRVQNLHVQVSPDRRAIFNDTDVENPGRIELRNVTTIGRVQLLGRGKVGGGHIEVDGLDILSADARGETDRPHGYGVYVLQGAFTLWNMQPEDEIVMGAELTNISVGRSGAPVLGSGVFVSGAGDKGGRLTVRRLEANGVYSDGKIPAGTPDQITGGVFIGGHCRCRLSKTHFVRTSDF
jgi:hypothetical protein